LVGAALLGTVTYRVVAEAPGPLPQHDQSPSSALPKGTPRSIVAWTSNDQIEVLSTRSGAVERVLASKISIFEPGLPSLSVSPDGVVYFDSAPIAGVSPPDAQGDQIFQVPLAGGAVREVAPGYDPAISPDGRQLAYVASVGIDEAPYMVRGGGIAIARLDGSVITSVITVHPGSQQIGLGVTNLSWSPSSKRLSFNLINGSKDSATSWFLPNIRVSTLNSAVKIPLHPAGLTWGGFLTRGSDGRDLGFGVLTSPQDMPPLASPQRVVVIHPLTGVAVRPLFKVPDAICTMAQSPEGPADCDADFTNALDLDSVGSGVLISGATPIRSGQISTTLSSAYLYRWSFGTSRPVRLASGVLVATWGS
jgi:hypothetical protein